MQGVLSSSQIHPESGVEGVEKRINGLFGTECVTENLWLSDDLPDWFHECCLVEIIKKNATLNNQKVGLLD